MLEPRSLFTAAKQFLPLDYEAFKIITEQFPDDERIGSTIITASRGEQRATENNENGYFTRALLEIFDKYLSQTLSVNKLVSELINKFSMSKGQNPSLKSYNPSNNWSIW
jgi:hypothetical protein